MTEIQKQVFDAIVKLNNIPDGAKGFAESMQERINDVKLAGGYIVDEFAVIPKSTGWTIDSLCNGWGQYIHVEDVQHDAEPMSLEFIRSILADEQRRYQLYADNIHNYLNKQ